MPIIMIESWLIVWLITNGKKSKIGWIFKSKANESYCLYNSERMVRHYALMYGLIRSQISWKPSLEIFQHIQECMEAIH